MKKTDKTSEGSILRKRAVELLKQKPARPGSQHSEADVLKLIHELEVHQIELELQNQELVLAKEQAAELAAEKYTELYDFAPSGYFKLSKEGRIIELNLCGSQMIGKERSRIKNRPFEFFVSDNTKPDFNLFLKKVFSTKARETCEATLSTNSDSLLYVYLTGIITDNGENCLIIVVDITERKLAEMNLIEKNEQIEAQIKEKEKRAAELIVANKELAYQNLEKEKRADELIIANKELAFQNEEKEKRAAELVIANKELAFQIKEKEKRAAELIMANKELAFQNEEKEKRAAELIIANKELAYQNKEKEKRADELIIANKELAFQNEEKEKHAAELIIANKELAFQIIEKEKRAAELIMAKEKAEESDRLKSAFLSNMSHEIRTPINGILGFTELLKDPDLTIEKKERYISIIERSGNRMLNIINDILEISKIESGQMKISISKTNVNEQIKYIYSFFKPEIEQKGIQIFFTTSLPLKKAWINTDREKIYSILTNLVKNAIKFTLKGYIEFGYNLKCTDPGMADEPVETDELTNENVQLEFFVKDTGVGIRHEQLKFVFERFRQGSNLLTRNYEGAGLGLSISKAYVEMLGGKIWVESVPGKGSVFYFTIPYHAETEEKMVAKNVVSADVEDMPMNKLKILIAEDDEFSEMLIIIAVERFCKKLLKVSSGVNAVETCRINPDIDLVLMDIKMPGMDGYEATRQIRQFNKNVVIIAQTAFGLTTERVKAIESGCNDYVSKPLSIAELISVIKKHF